METVHSSNFFGNSLLIRVVNDDSVSVDIETPLRRYGPIVKNLCPHGSLTLGFMLEWWEGQDNLRVPLKAIHRPDDGGKIAYEERTFNLNRGPDTVDNRIWEIRLQK